MFIENGNFIAPVLIFDKVNSNKRLYSKENASEIISEYLRTDNNKLGQFDIRMSYNEPDLKIDLSLASHIVIDLFMRENTMFAEIKILDTPKGMELKNNLVNNPDSICFRTAGLGQGLNNDKDGNFYIEKYKLLGIHALPAKEAVKL